MGSIVDGCCYSLPHKTNEEANDQTTSEEILSSSPVSDVTATTSKDIRPINFNNTLSTTVSSDSSDDDEASHLGVRQSFSFSRKISTKKGFNKSHCVKSGYLQIRRRTALHQWKRRYFWLKGRVLFYGRDDKADIFEEISLIDAKAAEERQKNLHHVFRILATPRNIELKADSRKEMESWIHTIDHASRQEFYDPNAQHTIISGQHTWYIMSHVKIVHCNICRELLSPGALPIVHGLSCAVCKTKSHKGCAIRASHNCKWSTLASVGRHVIEDADGTLDIEHQWIEGNLSHNSHCAVCDKKCGSLSKLVDWRCLWCKLKVHTACKELLAKRCTKAVSKYSVLSPVCIQSLDSSGLCAANNCRGGTTSPLLVFVNSKSGDNHGVKFLRRFKQLLNPAQVFDLMNGGPTPGLKLFRNLDQFRILICGGDGSISWVMSEMDKLDLHHKCQIGVLPLGTGNDLSRVLGWGSAIDNDSAIPDIIDELEQSQIKMLDRWSIQTFEWKQSFILPAEETSANQIHDMVSTVATDEVEGREEKEEETVAAEVEPNITMVDCLYKILYSSDYITVLNYSRSLCLIVDKFLSQLLSRQKLSSPEEGDQSSNPLFSQQFRNVQAKVKMLMDSLNETKSTADEQEMTEQIENHAEPENQPSQEAKEKVFIARETLMSRANSVKKAVLQIMEHTDAAINMSICANLTSLSGIKPLVHSTSDQESNTPDLDSPTSSNSHDVGEKEDNSHGTGEKEAVAPERVIFKVEPVEDSIIAQYIPASTPATIGSLSSSAGLQMSAPRNISEVSLMGVAEQGTSGSATAANQQTPKQIKHCPRVRNALAHKAEQGSFVSKVLMANADAMCAPVLPTFDDSSIQSKFEEKTSMNNYFGIGVDAKIVYQFHTQRDSHPEKFMSRFGNLLTMMQLGSKEIIAQTLRNFEKRIRLECDGQIIPLPNLQGIVVLNIPSYSGGTDFWGSHSRGSSEPFAEPSFDDKIIEVMAVYGSAHIGASRLFNFQYHRIAQCRSVKLTILGTDPVPMQVDGEAWMQNPGFIKISHKNRAQMLVKDKGFRHTFQSWSMKPKVSIQSQTSEQHGSPTRESSHSLASPSPSPSTQNLYSDTHMQSIVQATRDLIDCLDSLNPNPVELSEKVLAKCGEFNSLDDATQAGLQELTICSTELCAEVQELVNTYSKAGADADAADVERLQEALTHTKSKVEKYSSLEPSLSTTRKKLGRFAMIGRFLLHRRKRHSNSSSKSNSSAAESELSGWSTEDVAAWLSRIGMAEYSDFFIRNDIRGSELLQLQPHDFKDLGITKVGHIKRIQAALKAAIAGKGL
ncbi:diacylglycerol kinase delta-like isoform X2 [Watersipora subatra]|uniref:diacylglycerol kinase delta-like isoform X2 n=1 Tax=Watersipora subatra TaxID=2589382 RepID=UPI00355ACDBF